MVTRSDKTTVHKTGVPLIKGKGLSKKGPTTATVAGVEWI